MASRSPNPQRRSARSQAAILQAAFDLCQEQGYGPVTIEAIASRAGVGKQTIYRWWPSKGALLLDVFLEMLQRQVDGIDSGDVRGDMRRRVRAVAEALADEKIGPHIAGLLGEAQLDPRLAGELASRLVLPARATHRERLAAAQRDGQLRSDIDVDVMADALFGPIWFRLLITKHPLSAAYADAIVDAAMGDWSAPPTGAVRTARGRAMSSASRR